MGVQTSHPTCLAAVPWDWTEIGSMRSMTHVWCTTMKKNRASYKSSSSASWSPSWWSILNFIHSTILYRRLSSLHSLPINFLLVVYSWWDPLAITHCCRERYHHLFWDNSIHFHFRDVTTNMFLSFCFTSRRHWNDAGMIWVDGNYLRRTELFGWIMV